MQKFQGNGLLSFPCTLQLAEKMPLQCRLVSARDIRFQFVHARDAASDARLVDGVPLASLIRKARLDLSEYGAGGRRCEAR